MHLPDLVHRDPVPAPWTEGDNIPWNDPAFSARMLREHLSQAHDAASRRATKIDAQLEWIQREVLGGRPTRILDLGCGPGLYASRFARLGHTCVGIDYSPASIQYAQECARTEHLNCTYVQDDLRRAEFGTGFGLAMLIYGELNVFQPKDARHILTKARGALAEGGVLLLEPHTFQAVQEIGEQPNSWYSSPSGLFSEQPHLVLEEHFWNAECAAATVRHWLVDAATGDVTRYAASYRAYTNDEYARLLSECGFERIQFLPSLIGQHDASAKELMTIVAFNCKD